MSMLVDSDWEAQMEARNRMRCIDDILDDNQLESADNDFIIITNCEQQQPAGASTEQTDTNNQQQPTNTSSMHSTASHESLNQTNPPAAGNPKQANETIFENILKTAAYPLPPRDTPINNATVSTTCRPSQGSGGGKGGDTPRTARRSLLFGRRKRNRSLDSSSPPPAGQQLDVGDGSRRGSSRSNFWNSLGCGGGSAGRKSRAEKNAAGKSPTRTTNVATIDNKTNRNNVNNNNNNNNNGIQNGRPSQQQQLTIDAEKPRRISSTSTDVDEAYQSAQPSPAQSAASRGEEPQRPGSTPASSPPSPPSADEDSNNDEVVFGLNGVRLSNVVQRLLLCGNGAGSRRSPPKTGSGRAAAKPAAAAAADITASGLVSADSCKTAGAVLGSEFEKQSTAVPASEDRTAHQLPVAAVLRGQTADPASKKPSPRRSTSSSQRSSMIGNELGSIPENLPTVGLKSSSSAAGAVLLLPFGATDDVIGRRRRSAGGSAVVETPQQRERRDSSPHSSGSSKFDSVWPADVFENDPLACSSTGPTSTVASMAAAVLLESEIDDDSLPPVLQIVEVEPDVVDRTDSTSSSSLPVAGDHTERRSRRGVQSEAASLQHQLLSRFQTSPAASCADDRNFPRKSRRSSDRCITTASYSTPIKPCRSEEVLRVNVPAHKTPPTSTASPVAATSRRSRTRRSLDAGGSDGWRWVRSSRSTERSPAGGASEPATERGKSPLRRRSLSREMKVIVVRTEVELTEVRRPGSCQSLTGCSSVEDSADVNFSRPTSSCSERSFESSSLSAATGVDVAKPEVETRGRQGQYIRKIDVITSTLTEMVRNLEQDAEVKPENNDASLFNESEAPPSRPPETPTHAGSNTAGLQENNSDNPTDNELSLNLDPLLQQDDSIDDLIASLISIAGEDAGGQMTSHAAAATDLPRWSSVTAPTATPSGIGDSLNAAEAEVEMSSTTSAEFEIRSGPGPSGRKPEATCKNVKPEEDDLCSATSSAVETTAKLEMNSNISALRASNILSESGSGNAVRDLTLDVNAEEPKWDRPLDDVTSGTPTSTASGDTVVAVASTLTTSGFACSAEVVTTSTDAVASVLAANNVLHGLISDIEPEVDLRHGDVTSDVPQWSTAGFAEAPRASSGIGDTPKAPEAEVKMSPTTSANVEIHCAPAGREPEETCENVKPEVDELSTASSSTDEIIEDVKLSSSSIPQLLTSNTESGTGIGNADRALVLNVDVDEATWDAAVDDVTPGTPTSTASGGTVVTIGRPVTTSGFGCLSEVVITSTDAGGSALTADDVLRDLISDNKPEVDLCHGDDSPPVSTRESTSADAAHVTSPMTQDEVGCRRRRAVAAAPEAVATSTERRQQPEREVTSSAAAANRVDDVYAEKAFTESVVTSLGTILFLLVVYVLAAFIAYLLKTFVDIQDIS